jgi:hypothetical protein
MERCKMRRFRTRCRQVQEKAWRLGIVTLMLAVPITACGGAPQARKAVAAEETLLSAGGANTDITVTFRGEKCLYDGPDRVTAGRFRLILDVRDQVAHDGYAVVAVTLEEAKTREDLLAWPSANPPPWTHGHGAVLVPRGELGWQEIWLFKASLYLVCFTGDPARKTDLLGPIDVEASAPEARQLRERLEVRHPPEREAAPQSHAGGTVGVLEGVDMPPVAALRRAFGWKRVLSRMIRQSSSRSATEASPEPSSRPQHL